jgi:ubiquitin C-terminal hydrolase
MCIIAAFYDGQHESVANHAKKKEGPIDLAACLKAFTQEERLGNDEQWYCPKCKVVSMVFFATNTLQVHVRASKKLDIWTLPPFLVIHLKRFQNFNGSWRKTNREVRFPLTNFNPLEHSTAKMV